MFAVKLLANSVVAIVTLLWTCMNTFSHFISPITLEVLYYNWSLLKAVNALMSIIELCHVYIQFKRANQSCSPSIISQSINVEWRTCDRNGKHVFWWKQEKLRLFDKAKNVLIEKNKDMVSEKYIFTRVR